MRGEDTLTAGSAPRRVVAIVPAHRSAGSVATTVHALRSVPSVDEVLVVDDGSGDGTAEAALAAGARVLRLPDNRGKGGAVRAGVEASPDADVYLLIDADLAGTASLAPRLLEPVVRGEADMTVAVLPGAGARGGFGLVRRLAAAGIRRATGVTPRAPLSGQRAVARHLLRSLDLAPRFGLETGLTIDARRAGARVIELDVPMEHHHTGRGVAGFRHRAGQGVDVLRALWPRTTTAGLRMAVSATVAVVCAGAALVSGSRAEPASVAATTRPAKVLLFGLPHLTWDDVGRGTMPNLDELVGRGAVAATTVRTLSSNAPSTTEGYATLGAGTRVTADDAAASGVDASGEVAVVGAPATLRLNQGRFLSSRPGALGDALRRAGKRTAVVGNADAGRKPFRPAAVAVMDGTGSVDAGRVGPTLLAAEPAAAFGHRADPSTFVVEVEHALATADVVLADPGDLDRSAAFAPLASPEMAAAARRRALADTDRLLGDVRAVLDADTLLLVVSVAPPGREWRLTPMVAVGPGVVPGYLHSPSTRRLGVVTLTDVAPTVLDAVGVEKPEGMVGHALRYHPGEADLAVLERLDRDASYRDRLYLPLTLAYIIVQAIVYLAAVVAFGRLGGARRAGPLLRWVVLAIAAYPLATFAFRAIPDVAALGAAGVAVLLATDLAIVAVATRARGHPLRPLAWILAATVALLVVDVATGARLQLSSLLGYSFNAAARFTGLGNTAFAALAASSILLAAIHVHLAPRRREALLSVAGLFALVVLVDGAPALGSDVGGILTLVPVLGLTLLAMSGRPLSRRAVTAAVAVTLVAVALATVVDLLRPVEARTHLARLLAQIDAEGWRVLATTVSRKLSGSFRTYGSPWTWAVPVVAVYMLYVLGWARGWRRLLPPGSSLRAGVVGTLAAGLLGHALNDSGVVITAVVFVYLGPFLTLLALHDERGQPELLEPADMAAAGVGMPATGTARAGRR